MEPVGAIHATGLPILKPVTALATATSYHKSKSVFHKGPQGKRQILHTSPDHPPYGKSLVNCLHACLSWFSS